jgi:uncharacterized protein with gpF-like domain
MIASIRQRATAAAAVAKHTAFLQQQARQERRIQIDVSRWRAGIIERIVETLESWPNSNPIASLVWQPSAQDERSFRSMIRAALARAQLAGASLEQTFLDAAMGRKRQGFGVSRQAFRSVSQIAPAGAEVDPDEIYIDFSPEMRAAVDAWTAEREVGLWNTISSGTSRRLSTAISTGLADGLSIDDLTKMVRKSLTHYDAVQARRVARTEATGAMNHGAFIEQVDAEVPFREWLRTVDNRTRGFNPKRKSKFDHYRANQVVEAGEPFIVSGEKLNYPGDTSFGASAGNVINCRCSCAANFDGPKKPRPKKPKAPVQ